MKKRISQQNLFLCNSFNLNDLINAISNDSIFYTINQLNFLNMSNAINNFKIKFQKYIDAVVEDGGKPEFYYGLFVHYS